MFVKLDNDISRLWELAQLDVRSSSVGMSLKDEHVKYVCQAKARLYALESSLRRRSLFGLMIIINKLLENGMLNQHLQVQL